MREYELSFSLASSFPSPAFVRALELGALVTISSPRSRPRPHRATAAKGGRWRGAGEIELVEEGPGELKSEG